MKKASKAKRAALKVNVVSMPGYGSPVSKDRGPSEWEIEEDMRTLIRAEEIKRSPKRYAAAKKKAKEKLAEMKAAFPVAGTNSK